MRTISFDEKHLPDVDWCLKALSALDPLHMIFDPDYKPPSNHRGRRGIRYVPTGEDLYNLDEKSKKNNEYDKKNKSKDHKVNLSKNERSSQNFNEKGIKTQKL